MKVYEDCLVCIELMSSDLFGDVGDGGGGGGGGGTSEQGYRYSST